MKDNFVIGINSGTSFDGIDIALVRFKSNDLNPHFITGSSFSFPGIVKNKLRNLIVKNNKTTLEEISQLNFLLGEIFADCTVKFLKKNKLKPKDILLVACHGQTIYHHPKIESISGYKIRSTFQIGESSIISNKTGIKTISNFREADISIGGEGAPLMPLLDNVIFGSLKETIAILNIGGISNVSIVGKNISPIAFDIGPGNALLDLISKQYFNSDYDKDGKIAKSGKVDFKLIDKAIKDPYFLKRPPKSTGKEYFNSQFINKYFSKIKSKKDLLATLNYLSAKSIEESFKKYVFPKYKIKELIVSGGGVKNKTLINHIKTLMPNLKVKESSEYDISPKYKEAILFAFLGYKCHLQIPSRILSKGSQKESILGKISY